LYDSRQRILHNNMSLLLVEVNMYFNYGLSGVVDRYFDTKSHI